QTDPDETIAERLALYQVLVRWDYYKRRSESESKSKVWIPVSSSVLHLTKAHKDLQVPLHWTAPSEDDEDDKALDFYFKSVQMRDKTPEEILRLDHLELLPLLPATQLTLIRIFLNWKKKWEVMGCKSVTPCLPLRFSFF